MNVIMHVTEITLLNDLLQKTFLSLVKLALFVSFYKNDNPPILIKT